MQQSIWPFAIYLLLKAEYEDPHIALMDWSFGNSESFVTPAGFRIYILKGYLTFGRTYGRKRKKS